MSLYRPLDRLEQLANVNAPLPVGDGGVLRYDAAANQYVAASALTAQAGAVLVNGTLTVTGATLLKGPVSMGGLVAGALTVNSLTVTGATLLQGAATAGSLVVLGALNGGATVLSTLMANSATVTGAVQIQGASTLGNLVAGPTTLSSLTVTGAAVVQGSTNLGNLTAAAVTLSSLTVTGTTQHLGATLAGDLTAGITRASTLTVTGATQLLGAANTGDLVANNLTASTLTVTGGVALELGAAITGAPLVVTAAASNRCLTLTPDGSAAATIFFTKPAANYHAHINWCGLFQAGTDLGLASLTQYQWQSLTTGRSIYTIDAAENVIWGSGHSSLQWGVTGDKNGFFGATPILKPTVAGVTRGNAALQSVATALASLGLVTNSTAADDPTVPAWVWVNQGPATAVNGTQSVYLSTTGTTPDQLRIRAIPAPTGAYTLTAGLLPVGVIQDFVNAGLCLYSSSTSGVITLDLAGKSATLANARVIEVAKWTNTAAFSANYTTTPALVPAATISGGAGYWLQIHDDLTHRTYNISPDGLHWLTILTTLSSDFLTPTHVGFYVDANNATYGSAVNLFSWLQS